jgi:hypothetical protein
MSDKKLWAIERPDGSLVGSSAGFDPDEVWASAAASETPRQASGVDLRTSSTFGAACWRANGERFGFPGALAREIGLALGYKLVEVEIARKR